ncbi:MAG: hypothetical protein V5A55_07790 [Halovenus sp.]
MSQKFRRYALIAVTLLAVVGAVAYVGAVPAQSDTPNEGAQSSLTDSAVFGGDATLTTDDLLTLANGDQRQANETAVDDDGNAVLTYRDAINESTDGEFGLDVAEGLAYALVSDELEDEVTGEMSFVFDRPTLNGEGQFRAARPQGIEDLTFTASGERSDETSALAASLDVTVDTSEQEQLAFIEEASFDGTLNISVEHLSSSGQYELNADTPAGETQVNDVSIAENDQGGYTLDVERQRSLSEFESPQWETESAARTTLENQFGAIGDQLGGSATIEISSYNFEEGTDGDPTDRDRLEIAYTVEYTNIKTGLELALTQFLADNQDLDLSEGQAGDLAGSLLETDINAIEFFSSTDGSNNNGNWNIDIANYDNFVLTTLDIAAENTDDAERQAELEELRERLDAQRAVGLEQATSASFSFVPSGTGETVQIQASIDTETVNWDDYLDELESRGFEVDRETDIAVDASVETEGDDIVTDFEFSFTLGQLSEALMNGGGSGGDNQLSQFLGAANVDLARMDVDFQSDEVTMEASAKFNDTEALADALGMSFGDEQIEHIYGDLGDGTGEAFVFVNEFVGQNPTEDDVRAKPQVGPDTDVSLSQNLDEFPRLDTDLPREHLGLIDGSPVESYANEDGVVETDGLRTAIGDWRGGDIETGLLREVINAWRTGDPVT